MSTLTNVLAREVKMLGEGTVDNSSEVLEVK